MARSGGRLSARRRRILRRVALEVCPPDARSLGLADRIVGHVDATATSMSPLARRGLLLGIDLVPLGSRAPIELRRPVRDVLVAVAVLEEGPHRPTETFNGDELEMVRTLYRDGGVTATLGRPPIAYAEGRCVGGSTVVNGAMAWRTPERVLHRWRTEEAMPQLTHRGPRTVVRAGGAVRRSWP